MALLFTGSSSSVGGDEERVLKEGDGVRSGFFGQQMPWMVNVAACNKIRVLHEAKKLEMLRETVLAELRLRAMSLVEDVPRGRSTSTYSKSSSKRQIQCIVPTCLGSAGDYKRHLQEVHRMLPDKAKDLISIYDSVSIIWYMISEHKSHFIMFLGLYRIQSNILHYYFRSMPSLNLTT